MVINVLNLEEQLKTDKLESIYLLYGEETYLLENVLKRIKKIFGDMVLGINYITIDESNVSGLISDISTPAFGYEKKLIIIRNSKILAKEGRKKNEVLKKLKEEVYTYISENIDEIKLSTVLLFIEEDIEKSDLYNIIEKHGIVCNFEKQKLPDLMKRLKAICKAYSVNIDDSTLKYFIESCGTNMQDLINEIRKLIECVGNGGTINNKLVDDLSIKQIDSVIFDLTDSLSKKDIKIALEVLDGLVYKKEPMQKILITLYNHLKRLYITKLSEEYNKNLVQSLNLKPNQLFLTNKYKIQAKCFSKVELRQMLGELINLDANYKVGLIDLDIGLVSILCRYCS